MRKILLFLFILFALLFMVFAQQINHEWGMDAVGTQYTSPLHADVDTTATSGLTVYFDISDYHYVDSRPVTIDDSAVYAIDSEHSAFGTLRTYFDVQNAADSAIYTIKAYSGMYTNATKGVSSVKWEETAVTLRTVRSVDAFFQDNVYFASDAYKQYPPEIFKIAIQKVAGDTDCDDSTDVYVSYSYPAIYEQYKERKGDLLHKQKDF